MFVSKERNKSYLRGRENLGISDLNILILAILGLRDLDTIER